MPVSPHVDFQFVNNNVLQTTPEMGVSMLLARTTKGNPNDPSEIIYTYSQFQRVFGEEIVPDGSASNIEKALNGGSKLRIVRVLGEGAEKGYLYGTKLDSAEEVEAESVIPSLSNAITFSYQGVDCGLAFVTKGYGDPIGTIGIGYFAMGFYKKANTLYYKLYALDKSTDPKSIQLVEQGPLITWKNADSINNTVVDYLALSNFSKNSQYLDLVFVPSDDLKARSNFDAANPPQSFDNIITWLSETVDGGTSELTIEVFGEEPTATEVRYEGTNGNPGAEPTKDNWIAALEYTKDYLEDVYQLSCSHISQHLLTDTDVLEVHKAAAQMVNELEETTYYIEVPKYTTHYTQGTTPREYDEIVSWINTCLGTIGNSKWIAYFAGGIKYYNNNGILQGSDVIGTIMGLGDASATSAGVYRSFAGMNRGVIYDGYGPVCPNYGAPSRYAELNELAQGYANMIVIKDTSSSGKQTMLWHCFSSQVKQDSWRFLAIVRLCLYLKKSIRPIMNKYIEEPNIWTTWKNIYLEVKPILDALQDDSAITDWEWMGDQDATSWASLSVNNEADARQGKYKAILKFKDVVPMQEVTMQIVIDQASKDISVSLDE